MEYIEKNVQDLRTGDMINVEYGIKGNFSNLRIRTFTVKDGDPTTYIVGVFDQNGHPDTIQFDESEIIKVVVEKGNDNMAGLGISGVHKKLAEVQRRLVAPKNQYNSFGKYKYRSCEDILEGVKPLLAEVGVTLTITDEIVSCGNRIYVKATATFTDIDTQEKIINSAFAREEESKKGMDSSQVTGATSSYARKYALNGLFCIDDNKDSDTDEFKNQQHSNQSQQQAQQNQANQYMVSTVRKLCAALKVQEAQVCGLIATKKLEGMTIDEFNNIMANFKATPGYSDNLLQ